MPVPIPESHRHLLEEPIYAVFTTITPSGQPQSTVVWCDFDGTYIRINSTTRRKKDRNIRQNPKVALLLMSDPFFWIEVRGEVVEITEEGGVEHIERLSQRYVGLPFYGGYAPAERQGQETRVIFKIEPTHVTTYGKKH
jgi:PPOX class probable F420-dependent enzyme